MGLDFDTMLGHMGIPDTLHPCSTLSVLRPPVMEDYIYDWCTLGYSMTSPPNWWYSSFTPIGIYFDGPNPYLVDDSNMTHWAYAAFTDATQAGYMNDIMNVQEILVEEAYIVSVYTPTPTVPTRQACWACWRHQRTRLRLRWSEPASKLDHDEHQEEQHN